MTDPWDGYILPTKKTISLRSQMYVNVIPVDPSWVILLHEISIRSMTLMNFKVSSPRLMMKKDLFHRY